MNKALGQMWKEYEDKQKYESVAEEHKIKYQEDLEEYNLKYVGDDNE